MKLSTLKEFFDINNLDILDKSLIQSIIYEDLDQISYALAGGANIGLVISVGYCLYDYVMDNCSNDIQYMFESAAIMDYFQEIQLMADSMDSSMAVY